MGYLGVHMTLHPPDTDPKKKTRYKSAFFILGVLSVLLALVQGWRNGNAQVAADEAQRRHEASLARITEQTARIEKLATDNQRLSGEIKGLSRLAVEVAKLPTVLKRDLAPITFSVSEEPPNGDLRSCTVIVRTTLPLVRPRLQFTFDTAPRNAALEGVPDPQPWKRLDSSTLEYWYGGSGGQTVFSPEQPAVFHLSSPGPFRLRRVSYRE